MGECTGLPRLHAVQLTGLVALEQKQPVELVGLGTRERHNGLAVSAQAERQIDEMVGLEARVLGREARGARELPREVVGGAELFGPGARRAFGELRRQQLAILEHEPCRVRARSGASRLLVRWLLVEESGWLPKASAPGTELPDGGGGQGREMRAARPWV